MARVRTYRRLPRDAYLQSCLSVPVRADRPCQLPLPQQWPAELHALCLAALQPAPCETVVHIGAGTRYYTAILAELVGGTRSVTRYEIEDELAERAAANLTDMPNVTIHKQSGCDATFGACDVIYVSADATHPLDAWLHALRPYCLLLFPLMPNERIRVMLLVTRKSDRFSARFVCPAMFVPCLGARYPDIARRLAIAFARRYSRSIQSLRRATPPYASSSCAA